MKKLLLVLLTLAFTTGCSAQSSKQIKIRPNVKEDTLSQSGSGIKKSSFLENWNIIGNANWRMNENVIEADSGVGFLVTPTDYENFTLEVGFYAEENSNSGIFFRCNSKTDISDQNCYEANIFDACPVEHAPCRTGALTKIAAPKAEINTEGRWNKYVIHVEGQWIQIVLNNTETVFVRDDRHARGPIALQLKQGGIKFRNIKITN